MKNKNFKKNFKIAFVDQKGNIGGGMKFSNQLMLNFIKYYKNIKIDYYMNPGSIEKFRIGQKNFNNLNIKELKSLKLAETGVFSLKNSGKIIKYLQNRYLKNKNYINYYFSGNLKNELEKKLKNYDLIFFLWPYLIELPKVKNKKIIILHDLLFKYYFGGVGPFNLKEINLQNYYLNKWVKNSHIVLTSNFMKKEFLKFYPNIPPKKIHMIRVAPLTEPIIPKYSNILKKFKIKTKFILCPTVDKPHKNISNLIKAFYNLNQKFKNLSLVFCGAGTEIINGRILRDKVMIENKNRNVFGLGFVKDHELNYLIKKSELTISPSLYDPGCGSGLDAWQIGSLVAMSKINSFKEHIEYQKVKAITFDPNDHKDISKNLIKALNLSKKQRKNIINTSKKNINNYNWRNVVDKYYELIKKLS